MPTTHPYRLQPSKAFWTEAITKRDSLEITDWYSKKWPINDDRVTTAGSCFAQHIGRYLRNSGFNFLDVEPPPPFLPAKLWHSYGYNLYSARYGNIYSPRQLLQLLTQATGDFSPKEPPWPLGDGYVDPLRPTIEVQPFSSIEEVKACRNSHLAAVASLFEKTDLFVFTLGLTEAWVSREDGTVFPVCPGTKGGTFDASRYQFVNFSYSDVRADLEAFIALARTINKEMRFLLTVSPVPLMATATTHQVAVATTYSKSTLRAVAGDLTGAYEYVDYFPSFEIISSSAMLGKFFAPDKRSVLDAGVEHVMRQFFSEHAPPSTTASRRQHDSALDESDDLICDEILLDAFAANMDAS